MKSFQADYIFPVSSVPIKNGTVTVDDAGKIIAVTPPETPLPVEFGPITKLQGVICPGFINTHCHLELSHLKDKIEKGTGLVNFIRNVQKHRNASKSEMLDAANKANDDMYTNGIVAVGDISNSNLSIEVKNNSKIFYHTFIELFGFLPARAEEIFANGLALLKEFKPLRSSITPHAPYSVSKELFKLIKTHADSGHNPISMHNQEFEDENKFFRYRTGSLIDLYESFGMDISHFKAQARNSIQSVTPLLTNQQQILLVHNTFTNLKDIYFIKRFDRMISWCFCPNANLYIENTIPKVELFIGQGHNITLGTDSLASNNKLCILNEMLTIQQRVPTVNIATLLEWATINGARYLDIEDEKGSLEPGKTPGLNLITDLDGLNLTADTKVKRLI